MVKEGHLSRLLNSTSCRCGYKWGEHPHQAIINPKDNCFTCGAETDKRFYYARGNFCADCTRIVEMNSRVRTKTPEPKTYMEYLKLAGITPKEE